MPYGARSRSTCPRDRSTSRTVRRKRPFDFEDAGLRAMVVERALRMQRVDPRRLDRGLHVETEVDDVQQDEQDLLVLAVAAGCADREKRLAVLQHDGRSERRPRTFTAGEHVRAGGLEPECLHPVAHRHTGVARDKRAAEQPSGTRRGRKQISRRIGHLDRGGITWFAWLGPSSVRPSSCSGQASRATGPSVPIRAAPRSGSPGRCSILACAGSINARRTVAYSADSNAGPGTRAKSGSA